MKKTAEDIRKEVYWRLANPAKSPIGGQIALWLEQDPNGKVQTPSLTPEKGWVFRDHIEAEPCPYGSPAAHRGIYLHKDPLVERRTFVYVCRKPGQKNSVVYREPVYRLASNQKSKQIIRRLLIDTISQNWHQVTRYAKETFLPFNDNDFFSAQIESLNRLMLSRIHFGRYGFMMDGLDGREEVSAKEHIRAVRRLINTISDDLDKHEITDGGNRN